MITPERRAHIKDIFVAVVARPLEARRRVLTELCQGDRELETEVELLLTQHDEMAGSAERASPGDIRRSDHLLKKGEVLAERYRILEFLGSGGMGEVYEVEDLEVGERVAVKVIREGLALDSGVLDRLRREVQLARRVTHPNVCRVFDLGHHQLHGQECIFLTMELIKGETLSSRLRRQGKINPHEALTIAEQLCQALDAAHHVGILHRDFKPSNVMLLSSGDQLRAVVTDFGIARLMGPVGESTGTGATLTGTRDWVAGTPAYMSPEQLLGEKLTVASDIYSLGLVLYEMVTGNHAFRDDSSWTGALRRLTSVPTAPTEIVPELDKRWNSAILCCLGRDPAKRFSSGRNIVAVLTGRIPASSLVSKRLLVVVGSCILAIAVGGFAFRNRIWPPALPGQKRVAVLPFSFQGTDAGNQATAYGLAESLTGNLAGLQSANSSMWVVPWSAVKSQKPGDVTHAGASLGANLLVTGELQKDTGKLRLRTELKDASSLRQLRSQTIEISSAELIRLEDKLLQSVSGMLQIQIPSGTLHHLPVDETREPGAYEFFAQGRGYLQHSSRATPEDLERAISLLQKAIEKDPKFALAYANLASAYTFKFGDSHEMGWLDKAKQACQQALSLNDKLADAHAALGSIHQATGDEDGAIREFENALQLDPTSDSTLRQLSSAYDRAGRLLQAEALLKDTVKRSPGNFMNYNNLGVFYYYHAQYAQAEPLFRTATELAPDNPLAFYNLGGVYLAEGKYEEAETILTRAIAIKPSAGAYSNLGTIRRHQSRHADAATMFQKATELLPQDDRIWYNLAGAYTDTGNRSEANEAYEKAIGLAEKAVALRPKDGSLLGRLALYYAASGQKSKAQAALAKALRTGQNDPELLFRSAVVYELTGDRERALAAVRSALQAGYSLSEIQSDSTLAELRKDQRYAKMIGTPEHSN